MFTGANVTFFPHHFLGLRGMPRRVPDYPEMYRGWHWLRRFGRLIIMWATIIFIFYLWEGIVRRRRVARWGTPRWSFEWAAIKYSGIPLHTHRRWRHYFRAPVDGVKRKKKSPKKKSGMSC